MQCRRISTHRHPQQVPQCELWIGAPALFTSGLCAPGRSNFGPCICEPQARHRHPKCSDVREQASRRPAHRSTGLQGHCGGGELRPLWRASGSHRPGAGIVDSCKVAAGLAPQASRRVSVGGRTPVRQQGIVGWFIDPTRPGGHSGDADSRTQPCRPGPRGTRAAVRWLLVQPERAMRVVGSMESD